jgi:hypothetical protein
MTTADEIIYTVRAVPRVWSEFYEFPANKRMVQWRGMNDDSRFAMKTRSGGPYYFTPEQSDEVPGSVPEASFMALGETEEVIRIRIFD